MVANDWDTVVVDSYRRPPARIVRFEGLVGAAGAGRVRAHVQLQVIVATVLVTDERVAVVTDRYRRVMADVSGY